MKPVWNAAQGELAGRTLLVALAAALVTQLVPELRADSLAPRHREWLEGPTSYLITPEERKAFLELRGEAERDAFIERFWLLRDPTPGTEKNEFKEEFYRRVAYANAFFGREAGTDGWRTDRGKTYILFGRPQSTMNFTAHQELYPIELWFYANPGLAELPPFFYVLFYEKDGISGYRLYHPYVDGPDKLLRNAVTKRQAYNYLRNINPELARASLSLIPGEPIDTETFTGSMASSQIINAVHGFNQMPSYVASIRQRAYQLERVTSRIRYELPRASLATWVVFQDGEPWVHWRLEYQCTRSSEPAGGQLRHQVRARLFRAGQLIYERTDQPAIPVPAGQWEAFRLRPLAYEDRMPVTPGRYSLVVMASDGDSLEAEATAEFDVPQNDQRPHLSDLLLVEDLREDPRDRPFRFGNIKFYPATFNQVASNRPLRILFQILLPEPKPSKLEVEYALGTTSGKARRSWRETLDASTADASGTLLVARTITLEEFPPGGCRIAVRVRDPERHWQLATAKSFVIAGGAETLAPPVVISPNWRTDNEWRAATAYERALCWLASNQVEPALELLRQAWQWTHNSAVRLLLDHLEMFQHPSSQK